MSHDFTHEELIRLEHLLYEHRRKLTRRAAQARREGRNAHSRELATLAKTYAVMREKADLQRQRVLADMIREAALWATR